jgi:hypothetical protein
LLSKSAQHQKRSRRFIYSGCKYLVCDEEEKLNK